MRAKMIAAVILATLMLISCVFGLGEGAPEGIVQEIEVPVQVTPVETKQAEETSVEPVDETTPAPVVQEEAAVVAVDEASAAEAPATPVVQEEAAVVAVDEASAAEAPATEIPENTEAPEYKPVYAAVSAATRMYADRGLTVLLGELTGSEILYVIVEDAEYNLYAAIFDTDDTIGGSAHIGYFSADGELGWLNSDEAGAAVFRSVRNIDGVRVPRIDFAYAKEETGSSSAPEDVVADAADPVPVEPELPEEELIPSEPADDSDVPGEPELLEEELIPSEPADDSDVPGEPELLEEELIPSEPANDSDMPGEPELLEEELIPSEPEDTAVVMPSEEEPAADDTAVEDDAAAMAAECRVIASVYCESETVSLGDMITIKAELIGYEGLTYTCEWECAPTDETGAVVGEWQPTGITALEHSFVLDEVNCTMAWRLRTIVEF